MKHAVAPPFDVLHECSIRWVAWKSTRPTNRPGAVSEYLGGYFGCHYLVDSSLLFGDANYGAIVFNEAPPQYLDSYIGVNDSDTQDHYVYNQRKTSQAHIQTTVTRAIKSGVSGSLKLALPFVGDIGINASVDLTFTEAKATSQQETQEWSWSETIHKPPRSIVEVTVLVATQQAIIPVTARARLSGRMFYTFDCRTGRASGRAPLGSIFIVSAHPDVNVIDDFTIEYPVECLLLPTVGTKLIITKKQMPIGHLIDAEFINGNGGIMMMSAIKVGNG